MVDQNGSEIDSVTQEVVHGTAIPQRNEAGTEQGGASSSKNAFSELMARKPKQQGTTKPLFSTPPTTYFAGRNGLKAYTVDPTAFPSSRVLTHDSFSVLINDLYPKSSVHTLVLPCDPTLNAMHPFDAFLDPDFLAATKVATAAATKLVASELRRRYGRFSATERARVEALESDDPPETLPPGRDWLKEVKTGVHALPSMAHVHVHVLSVDNVGEFMKHRRHYENFNTGFLVPLEDFPLAEDDPRRDPEVTGILGGDLICWRCKKSFGHKWTRFRQHLDEEFEAWKRE